MKFSALTASLFAFAVFATPVMAEELPAMEQSAQDELAALLADSRPASELSEDELRQRFKSLRGFLKNDGLPRDVKKTLQRLAKEIRSEIANREQNGGQQQVAEQVEPEPQAMPEQPVSEEPVAEQPSGEEPAAEPKILRKKRRLAQPVVEEPVAEPPPVEQVVPEAEIVPDQPVVEAPVAEPEETQAQNFKKKRRAGQPVAEQPMEEQPPPEQPAAELPAEQAVPKLDAPAAAIEKKQIQALDGNQANPESEAKANEFLNDDVDAARLSDDELRARLDDIRDLMAGNQLSRGTERMLRRKLRAERDVLRNRMAIAEAEVQLKKAEAEQSAVDDQPSTGKGDKKLKPDFRVEIAKPAPARIVLQDRRASDDLEEYELRRRIGVLRDSAAKKEFDEEDRMLWRKTVERDRRVLRDRMITDRRRRSSDLQIALKKGQLDINLGVEFQSDDQPDHVFAAEVDDSELEEILVAPPRRKLRRHYTIDEVEASPELRDAVSRIEIDTIHFGFGEAFVREEEVENLDRIAEIMERILTVHPREVFMIEGHTDAVGSNAANLSLSRQRAVAIKKALNTYYVIPSANLRTVGYGERFLKIPTSEAEEENRRVSIARATELIGEVDESELEEQ